MLAVHRFLHSFNIPLLFYPLLFADFLEYGLVTAFVITILERVANGKPH